MTIIEGIGDEVVHFFIALFVVVIGTAAWWTTNISEQRYIRTAVILERRRHRTHRRLTNHTETVTIVEASTTSPLAEEPQSTPETPVETPASSEQSATIKPPELTVEGTSSNQQQSENITAEGEEESIIETMDADANVVRQRRLAFYSGFANDQPDLTESNSGPPLEEPVPSAPPNEESEGQSVGITVKLKFINDDLKLVDGKLNESLGDFKKRHFLSELSSNKLVRLIFNGQVLQPDTQTLKSCGLFDNCVVHCLIHQKRNQANEQATTEGRREGYSFTHTNGSPNNNNQYRDWDLGNFLFASISIILLAAWYFRYMYAHLYTVTTTIGLILITGIFTIFLVGMYFPDNEQYPNPTFHIRERTRQQQ
ncbi:unnamed protein product [Phyllotreta striolata]|uniref:Ubiquitin-like domain-containing protein n=1 Tax=Phyllotreta striolata TaxID=444603 RepID=A0A9N9XP79_PHYSR|nr:unnamed protein product [Phyllotreta striolata]